MSHRDLRAWIGRAEELGQVRRIEGADCHLEIGAIADLVMHREQGPALLFQKIKGYPPDFRVLANSLGSLQRTALTLGLPSPRTKQEAVSLWRQKLPTISLMKPRLVEDGPVCKNIMRDADVDLSRFPVPLWHEKDGGRYIGTGSVNITLDPDSSWVNLGCYRVMLYDDRHVFFYVSPGRHGYLHREKYFARNLPCPVAISLGHDPLILAVGAMDVPYGVSEYEFGGGIQGEPIEVVKGEYTGLPIPAHAEIVLEGDCVTTNRAIEGPFGEFTGYYGSGARAEPLIEVKRVYFRDDPILLGAMPAKPPTSEQIHTCIMRSAFIWDQLEKAEVPGVTGVWCHEAGAGRMLVAISIKQSYFGHARQAAHVAAFCHSGAYMGRFIIVVDDDVDASDLGQVMWAACTRSDPERSVDVAKRCWSGPLDPAIRDEEKGFSSRLMIDACRPFEWRQSFRDVVEVSEELRKATLEKWGETLDLK